MEILTKHYREGISLASKVRIHTWTRSVPQRGSVGSVSKAHVRPDATALRYWPYPTM